MELLAPAGNLQKLKSAVLYGADAVYLAGPRFGLRGASDNFSDHELQQSVEFAHSRNCKVYVTLNAFLHESDMVSLPEYVEFLAECKVDAVIVADLGVMSVGEKSVSIKPLGFEKNPDLKWRCSSMVRCAWHFPETVPSQIILQAETAIAADVSRVVDSVTKFSLMRRTRFLNKFLPS